MRERRENREKGFIERRISFTIRRAFPIVIILSIFICFNASPQPTSQNALRNPLGVDIVGSAERAIAPENLSTTLTLVFLITAISLAPAFLVLTTSFTRIIVVLSFLRQALATQQTPPNQVLIGLALFLTLFIMMPTYERVNREAIQPYIRGELNQQEAFGRAIIPIREFMFKQVKTQELKMMMEISGRGRPNTPEDVPTHVLIPAFILSELKTAFMIGFLLYIPFLIIDMVVASSLMAMGMMMLPPIFVSLPFKLILFVLVDGWNLVIGNLVRSYQ
ncbi:MAG: flagellar type III secretion system pore protein FliP [Candidatus Hydrogenedentes bacterium]|nr:flagellar type III secretion system pore protein FliP [Candidatus Hydrogenedentota bacterium]